MSDIPLLAAVICDDAGNRRANIPPIPVKTATLVLTSMDDFPASQAVFGADDRAAIRLIQPFDTIKFYQRGVRGHLSWHVIEDPALQIKDDGDEITLALPNITDQMTRYSIGVGATFETTIGAIVQQVGAQGESVVWTTVYNSDGTIGGFFAAYPDQTLEYNVNGVVVGTFPGTGKSSGWSAVALDDGPNVLSASAVVWSTVGTVQAISNNLQKQTANPAAVPPLVVQFAYDSYARGATMITQAHDASGNPSASDGTFQFQASNVATQVVAGIGRDTALTTGDVLFGFELLISANPTAPDAFGAYNFWINGSRVAAGPGQTYVPGDVFSVGVDYSVGGVGRILMLKNGLPITPGGLAAPTLPYRPIAFIANPGGQIQNCMLMTTTTQSQQNYLIKFDQQTPLEGEIQLALATGLHVRQRRDGQGAPIRALEVGLLGAQTGIRLTGGIAGNRDKMLANPKVRLISALTWQQESAKVINTITPLGASTGDGQVDLERAWQIFNDPLYQNYHAKWGGMQNIFPEYDHANYPIQRTLGRNGVWEYWVRDIAAYNRVGFEIRGKYTDPQFQYVDSVVANQEQTARALYQACVAKLMRESQINDVLAVECAPTFRPPNAGDRVLVDFRRLSSDTKGNFTVMSTQARTNLRNPYVTKVTRVFSEQEIHDAYELSFLPRNLQSVGNGAASLRDLEAIKIVPQNQTTYLYVGGEGDVDNHHDLIVQCRIPTEAFRVTQAPLDIQFSALRQQVQTADNQTQNFTITIPMFDVVNNTPLVTTTAAHGSHTLQQVTGATAYQAGKGYLTSDVDLYLHVYAGSGGNTGPTVGAAFQPGPQQYVLAIDSSKGATGDVKISKTAGTVDPKHSHITPLQQGVGVGNANIIGHIDTQQISATLPPHFHPIRTNINDTTAPQAVTLFVDPGTGVWQEITFLVRDQRTNGTGPWSADCYLPDLSKYVNHPGQLVRIKLSSVDPANLGVGHLKAVGLWRTDIGGLATTFLRAAA